jgi:3-deoxy-D-manno-octulosonic-acid transferase
MNILYNILIEFIDKILLPILSIFSKKISRFLKVRESLFQEIDKDIDRKKKYIWMHAASLGEYELAIPLIKEIKKTFENEIILTFFSESGFKLKDRRHEISRTYFLPIDSNEKAKKLVKVFNPRFAVFIKSEIWPNYINVLKKEKIKFYLVNYVFDKYNSRIFRGILKKYTKVFTQDENSERELKKMNIDSALYIGNLKFNRAKMQKKEKYNNKELINYLGDDKCIVFGSTWERDEEIIFDYMSEEFNKNVKYIIAPHEVSEKNINRIKSKLNNKVNLLSDNKYNAQNNILIIDTIGVLKYLYKFSHISYVGGGFKKKGLHNILEPCVYGNPVIFGKYFKFSNEAKALIKLKGGFSIQNSKQLMNTINGLLFNANKLKEIEIINSKFIDENLVSINSIIKSMQNE